LNKFQKKKQIEEEINNTLEKIDKAWSEKGELQKQKRILDGKNQSLHDPNYEERMRIKDYGVLGDNILVYVMDTIYKVGLDGKKTPLELPSEEWQKYATSDISKENKFEIIENELILLSPTEVALAEIEGSNIKKKKTFNSSGTILDAATTSKGICLITTTEQNNTEKQKILLLSTDFELLDKLSFLNLKEIEILGKKEGIVVITTEKLGEGECEIVVVKERITPLNHIESCLKDNSAITFFDCDSDRRKDLILSNGKEVLCIRISDGEILERIPFNKEEHEEIGYIGKEILEKNLAEETKLFKNFLLIAQKENTWFSRYPNDFRKIGGYLIFNLAEKKLEGVIWDLKNIEEFEGGKIFSQTPSEEENPVQLEFRNENQKAIFQKERWTEKYRGSYKGLKEDLKVSSKNSVILTVVESEPLKRFARIQQARLTLKKWGSLLPVILMLTFVMILLIGGLIKWKKKRW